MKKALTVFAALMAVLLAVGVNATYYCQPPQEEPEEPEVPEEQPEVPEQPETPQESTSSSSGSGSGRAPWKWVLDYEWWNGSVDGNCKLYHFQRFSGPNQPIDFPERTMKVCQ